MFHKKLQRQSSETEKIFVICLICSWAGVHRCSAIVEFRSAPSQVAFEVRDCGSIKIVIDQNILWLFFGFASHNREFHYEKPEVPLCRHD